MCDRDYAFADLVETRFPGLTEKVRQVIRASEAQYEGVPEREGSFLWEHTAHVSSLVCRLAGRVPGGPVLPVIAALFHDVGKFAGGKYHENGTPEEVEAARVAGALLPGAGMKPGEIRKIVAGLTALYNEEAGKNEIADLVHDADFLSKFGALGVAGFFVKSTLRGRTLGASVRRHLSKELTYASSLPQNMRTRAGRRMAVKKSADSLKFFRSLLADLREAEIADLRIRRVRIPDPRFVARSVEILLVLPRACAACGGSWRSVGAMEQGVKCNQLSVDTACRRCGNRFDTSFCLPEIVRFDNAKLLRTKK